jgi:lipopolysaccharide export system permease protein
MFIFVLQSIWLYISELAGKDLAFSIILKFLWFFSPKLIPMVLPLTILVASLMVFGSFAEKYEFAAMKSTGISLQRAMRSLMVFIVALAAIAFLFTNNVIPWSEYKWQNLRRNIAQLSPSMVIAEGQFSQVGDDFNIKVDKKYGDREQYLDNVVIHKKNPKKPNGNFIVMLAEEGELIGEENSNTLTLLLKKVNYYEDVQTNKIADRKKLPFAKSYLEEYAINLDLTKFNDIDVDKENELNSHNMYQVQELVKEIDTLSQAFSDDIEAFGDNMYFRTGIVKFNDEKVDDSIVVANPSGVLDIIEPRRKLEVLSMALNNVKGTIQSVGAKKNEFKVKVKRINKHEIAFHEKFALTLACIILFFVGAPLGAIIRKGGMGLPMVIAILLFLTYHFIGIFAKNSAEDGTLHPFIATWLSTVIMLPLSIWLTYRATTDQGLFDMDTFFQRIGRLFGKKSSDAAIVADEKAILLTQQEKALVLSRTVPQLKDIVKNYRQYGYTEEVRSAAIQQLNLKGFSEMELKLSGDFENLKYSQALEAFNEFSSFSRKSLIAYFTTLVCFVGIIVFNNVETSFSAVLKFIFDVSLIISMLLFYFFTIRTLFSYSRFQKLVGKQQDITSWIIFLIFGPAIYVLLHISFKKKMKEELEIVS